MEGGDKYMNDNVSKKLAIPLVILTIVGVGGSFYTLSHVGPTNTYAQSQTHQPVKAQTTSIDKPETVADKTDVAGEDNYNDLSYTSSIRFQSTQEVSDDTEAKQLASLAKISSDQAKAFAEKSAGAAAFSVKIEEENGNVVYSVSVGIKEVKVDAGNGAILQTETDEENPNQAEGAK